jgi:hypothetical protein
MVTTGHVGILHVLKHVLLDAIILSVLGVLVEEAASYLWLDGQQVRNLIKFDHDVYAAWQEINPFHLAALFEQGTRAVELRMADPALHDAPQTTTTIAVGALLYVVRFVWEGGTALSRGVDLVALGISVLILVRVGITTRQSWLMTISLVALGSVFLGSAIALLMQGVMLVSLMLLGEAVSLWGAVPGLVGSISAGAVIGATGCNCLQKFGEHSVVGLMTECGKRFLPYGSLRHP